MESVDGFLVPKLCLGMPLSRQLCCHTGETELESPASPPLWRLRYGEDKCVTKQSLGTRVEAAFQAAAMRLWFGGGDGVGENRIGNKPPLRLRCTYERC